MESEKAFLSKKLLFINLILLLVLVFGVVGQVSAQDTHYAWWDSLNPTSPYTTWNTAAHNIQPAIDVASSGDTVMVRAGTYNEDIAMTDGVHVVSETGVKPAIVGTGNIYPVVAFDGDFTNGCTLDGFDISGGGTNPGIYLHATTGEINNSTTIKNCSVHGNGGPGIKLDGSVATTAPTIDNNDDIYGNTKEGIYIMNASSVSGKVATILNNTIRENTLAGINIGGASYVTVGTVGSGNVIRNNYAGIAFDTGTPSSQPVEIVDNDIFSNNEGGICLKDSTTGQVTITQNDIHENTKGGIGIQNACDLVITKNKIRDNVRGGIHTGTDVVDGGGFSGSTGSANLTIRQNKVYNNGQSDYGGGIDVRHGSGEIHNNLIYENHRGGIRFGDYITEIINNTVVDNGSLVEVSPGEWEGNGGGIIYDDLAGAVNDSPAGSPTAAIPIRNNICVYNEKAGIRDGVMCTSNRDYNLLYSNQGWDDNPDCNGGTGPTDCVAPQLGGCWKNDNEIFANPLFKYDCLIDDDTNTGNSPAGGTYVLFDLLISYTITDVRLYGSATTYTWDVYVDDNPSGCTGTWGTLVKGSWTVGSGWNETPLTTITSGRYIKLVSGSDINENTIFEFDYKSTETDPNDWQTPVVVVYKCTDIAEDNYELLSDSPARCAGICPSENCNGNCLYLTETDMGAYGGVDPIDW